MAESVDAPDLKSVGHCGREGSSPSAPIKTTINDSSNGFSVPLFIKDLEPEQDAADMEKYIQRFHKKTLGEYNERPTTLLGDARDDYLVHLQPEFDG